MLGSSCRMVSYVVITKQPLDINKISDEIQAGGSEPNRVPHEDRS